MFRRGRRCLAIALAVAALALPAAPVAAAGRDAAASWTLGMELWARLSQLGDWLRTIFLSDGTPYIDPDGVQGASSDGTSFIDPDG